jgi:hypothetical protein
MKHSSLNIISSVILASALLPAFASASTSVISLSDSVSGTVQSVSNSVSRSSNSSSNAVKVAEGDYRVVDVAMVEGQPDKMRLKLEAVAMANEPQLYLFVPRHDYDQARLNNGQIVTASKRPYGLAFSLAHVAQPFAVVLDQDWKNDLTTHVVAG